MPFPPNEDPGKGFPELLIPIGKENPNQCGAEISKQVSGKETPLLLWHEQGYFGQNISTANSWSWHPVLQIMLFQTPPDPVAISYKDCH